MNTAILCVGALKEKWQKDACQEYLKRLTRYGRYEVIQVDDYPEPAKENALLNQQVMEKEGKALLARIRPGDRVIALAIQGESLDSLAFAARTREWEMDGRRAVFVIGGSLGLSAEVMARADVSLSFSRFTFPHPLMRVILLEQLYRAARINAGDRYHK